MVSIDYARNFLKKLKFFKSNNSYSLKVHNYVIECGFEVQENQIISSYINYGDDIIISHQGICNFSKEEYLVQLECVIRLLKKGYMPNQIELEKKYPLGHKDKGRLDVLVKKQNIPWLMIECKTIKEYDDEIKRVERNGSQIFSYYAQDRTPSFIGVYASDVTKEEFEFYQISTQNLEKLGSAKDIFKSWDKHYNSIGLFAEEIAPYECDEFNLRKSTLKDLNRENGTKLYNRFMEILRRHAISDKSNAFNIFFNLFVCKIYDEETKAEDDILDFQWKLSDDVNIFISRISKLYYSSLQQYLGLECSTDYYSKFGNGVIFPVREFSFVEILNENDFNINAGILIEVVKLLQEYKIKYFTRQQFLGDFFENLLNKGFKQESGQFFTPYPLARFILRSLPINKIIEEKSLKHEPYILPYTLDYACGSGHFLTEAIMEIEKSFNSIDIKKLNGPQCRNFENLRNNYYWAKEYIYGIEKDSRLAKTTKIAMFLNGDGDADIISADGLGDFYKNRIYRNKLKISSPKYYNNSFDMLISNPPFTVDGFFNTVENLDAFALSKSLSKNSAEIECFFLERALQILSPNGYCGLIFPMSLFNNTSSIYNHTRQLLLINFDIYAFVEMREKAFSATNTTTVIVFAKKKSQERLENELLAFAKNEKIEENNINIINALNDIKTRSYITSDIDSKFCKYLVESYKHDIIVGFSGEKKKQEYFQGYRFSKGRGKEELVEKNYGILTAINSDYGDGDLASVIHKLFNGSIMEIKGELAKYCQYISIDEMLTEYSNYLLAPPSKWLTSKTIKIDSISPIGDIIDEYESIAITLEKLFKNEEASFLPGLTYDKSDEVPYVTKNVVLTASNIDLNTGTLTYNTKLIYLNEHYKPNQSIMAKKGDIVISMSSGSLKHLGKVAYVNEDTDFMVGGFLGIIRCKDKKLAKAIYYRLLSKRFREYVFSKKGQNINNLSSTDLIKISLDIPKNIDTFIDNVAELVNGHKGLQ